jgi:hypothetical protein
LWIDRIFLTARYWLYLPALAYQLYAATILGRDWIWLLINVIAFLGYEWIRRSWQRHYALKSSPTTDVRPRYGVLRRGDGRVDVLVFHEDPLQRNTFVGLLADDESADVEFNPATDTISYDALAPGQTVRLRCTPPGGDQS